MDKSQLQTASKSYINETDLFKLCIINPKYTSQLNLLKKDLPENPYQMIQNPETKDSKIPSA
jgi:hypothetical protein